MEFRQAMTQTLAKMMQEDEKICILDADLAKPNGTTPLYEQFPNRCFDVGIAEANMIGIAAGLSFASLLAHIKNRLLPMALLCLSICLFGIALANNLLTLILSSVGVGFFYSIILTFIFHRLSECIARNLLNKATAYVLLGCNLGSAVSPYVLKLLALVSSSFSWIFLAYAIVSFLLFLGFLLNSRMVKKP